MNPCFGRASGAGKFAALLGTASLLTLTGVSGVAAQETPGGEIEQVLVTGSLIRGSEAVGVPVTALAAQDFAETGSINIGDMMRNVPAAVMVPVSGASNHGQSEQASQVNFHGLDSFNAPRDLLMVDGMRVPPGGHNGRYVNPEVIPIIAVDHVDVLVDGASATYGSDAVSGVVNVILRRNFDGAKTSVRFGRYPGGGEQYQAEALWGRTWDGGGITVSYEWYNQEPIENSKRSNMTADYRPWGLDDQTPLGASIPGVVSIGAPNVTSGAGCTNCYTIPSGQDGKNLTWANILSHPGVTSLRSPYDFGWALPKQQRNAAVLTVDQRLLDGVSFFGTGYYSNRRVQLVQSGLIAKSEYRTYTIPTTNPYYPIGAPAGLRYTGNFVQELTPQTSGYQTDGRYDFGLNIALPFDWAGKIYSSISQTSSETRLLGEGHSQSANAALGIPQAAVAPYAAYSKPPNIPYLNVFCDPFAFTCNDPRTLAYIEGTRVQTTRSIIAEKGVNADGALFSLPAGDVRAAVGATYTRYSVEFVDDRNDSSPTTDAVHGFDPNKKTWWAVFAQLNVPIFSEANSIPLFHKLEIEGSWRHDQYSDVGGTSNPKVAINWDPVEDLTIRGTWGTSFRAPGFQETSPLASNAVSQYNKAIGESTDTIPVACKNGLPTAGSAAAMVNPTCSADPRLAFPGGLVARGSAGGTAFLRGGTLGVSPEHATNYGLGFQYTPTNFLKGLDVELTYYKVHISNILQTIDVTASNFNDPNYAFLFITPNSVGAAEFARLVDVFFTLPATLTPPSFKSNVLWLADGGVRNLGSLIQDGLDFNAHYDWDMADRGLGLWEIGVTGTYTLKSVTSLGIPGTTPVDAFHTSIGSGAVFADGIETRPRYVYRARLGWSDMGWTVTGFFNYSSHYFSAQLAPPASFLTKFPNYSNLAPEYHTFDLSVGYNTGVEPQNDYLKNLNIQFVVNNILNKYPAFQYNNNVIAGSPTAYDPTYSDNGRLMQITISKSW